jgi:diaminopimelate decarboxylase
MSTRNPIYVYDLAALERRCDEIDEMPVKDKAVFFATMANDHPAILSFLGGRGYGVFVNSPQHLRLALDAGFDASRVTYAASNMTRDEMEECLLAGVRLILDSVGQVGIFCQIADPGAAIGVRLNVGSCLDGKQILQDPNYRFGILPREIPTVLELARRAGTAVTGAHCYFGTGVMEPAILLDGLARLAEAARALADLCYLDVGGGFGVSDKGDGADFDIWTYGRGAAPFLDHLESAIGRPIELVIEPGRFLTASCGYFFVSVTDVKVRDDRIFVGVNACVSMFPRPLLYPEYAKHPCELLGPRRQCALSPLPIYICGNSTYSRDFLARDVRLPVPFPDDVIAFGNAGAYCMSMVSDFLGKGRPEERVLVPQSIFESAMAVGAP